MRLGYLIPEFPGQTHAFFWREAAALQAQGFTVDFISTRAPAPEARARHAFADDAVRRTTYLFPPRPGAAIATLSGRPRATRQALRYLAGLSETALRERTRSLAYLIAAADLVYHARVRQLDHVHLHSFANAAHVAALARILGGPSYSLTLHGDLDVYGTDHAAKVAGAAFVTTVTRPLAAAMRRALPGCDPAVISMGVDTDSFRPGLPATTGPMRLLSVARLTPVKGHVHLLRALARLVAGGADVHLTIAGEGPHRAAIAAEIIDLGLSDRVEMTGSVSEAGVLRLLQQSHALALTSFGLGEAAPVAVMEAMSCGLPVICSEIGGTADMIDDGVDGLLVPQQDEGAIAAALATLACNPQLRGKIGAAARARAIRQFDYRARAAELGSLIRDRAGRHRTAQAA